MVVGNVIIVEQIRVCMAFRHSLSSLIDSSLTTHAAVVATGWFPYLVLLSSLETPGLFYHLCVYQLVYKQVVVRCLGFAAAKIFYRQYSLFQNLDFWVRLVLVCVCFGGGGWIIM